MSGWTDFPLSNLGHEQVRRLSDRMREEAPFARIYSSPLSRALQTASPLSEAGLGPIETCADLREIDCGEVDGMLIAEVERRYPALVRANLEQRDDDFRWPGGESYAELRARALSAIERIGQRNPGARVALVTHAGFISQVLGFVCGSRPALWQRHRPENASLTELSYERGSLAVVRFDDHEHLVS